MKYPTVAALAEAYKLGEVHEPVVLDNDDSFTYQGDEKVFQMDPHDLLRQSLDLLGIPHEEC